MFHAFVRVPSGILSTTVSTAVMLRRYPEQCYVLAGNQHCCVHFAECSTRHEEYLCHQSSAINDATYHRNAVSLHWSWTEKLII